MLVQDNAYIPRDGGPEAGGWVGESWIALGLEMIKRVWEADEAASCCHLTPGTLMSLSLPCNP